jgi:ATP adenylyltransferase
MERLWAPWRMTYINGIGHDNGCFLCAAAIDEHAQAENLVLWRSDHAVCVMNRFPYNNGHLLVAPVKHTGELADLAEEERAALFDAILAAKALLEKAVKPNGFNIGFNLGRAAGAGLVDHVHCHIVPRWDGDTNFMPVLADTKVMPQLLADLYKQLREAL